MQRPGLLSRLRRWPGWRPVGMLVGSVVVLNVAYNYVMPPPDRTHQARVLAPEEMKRCRAAMGERMAQAAAVLPADERVRYFEHLNRRARDKVQSVIVDEATGQRVHPAHVELTRLHKCVHSELGAALGRPLRSIAEGKDACGAVRNQYERGIRRLKRLEQTGDASGVGKTTGWVVKYMGEDGEEAW